MPVTRIRTRRSLPAPNFLCLMAFAFAFASSHGSPVRSAARHTSRAPLADAQVPGTKPAHPWFFRAGCRHICTYIRMTAAPRQEHVRDKMAAVGEPEGAMSECGPRRRKRERLVEGSNVQKRHGTGMARRLPSLLTTERGGPQRQPMDRRRWLTGRGAGAGLFEQDISWYSAAKSLEGPFVRSLEPSRSYSRATQEPDKGDSRGELVNTDG